MELFAPAQAYIAVLIEYFDENDALDWARDYHEKNPDTALAGLLRVNRKQRDELRQVATLLGRFVAATTPEFDVRSKDSEGVARRLFIARLRQYLHEGCLPWAVCRMVSRIEQLYDFPSWLGNMYDACDWIKPNDRPVDCRHLEEAIKAHLLEGRE